MNTRTRLNGTGVALIVGAILVLAVLAAIVPAPGENTAQTLRFFEAMARFETAIRIGAATLALCAIFDDWLAAQARKALTAVRERVGR